MLLTLCRRRGSRGRLRLTGFSDTVVQNWLAHRVNWFPTVKFPGILAEAQAAALRSLDMEQETPQAPKEDDPFELVTVFEARDSFALSLAKAALEDSGIEYLVAGEEPGLMPGLQGTSGIGEIPLWKCSCRIQVTREFEQAARELLEPLRNPEPVE